MKSVRVIISCDDYRIILIHYTFLYPDVLVPIAHLRPAVRTRGYKCLYFLSLVHGINHALSGSSKLFSIAKYQNG